MSKKDLVLTDIFKHCHSIGNYIFDNDFVKVICKKHNFGNPFDATKLDNTSKFPNILLENDFFLLHLGEGRHKFVKGIKDGFHTFEEITDIVDWQYRKSLLNEFDTSESNILSVGFNQRIIHDFLYDDIVANPKVYNSRRTKSTINYLVGKQNIQTKNLQMEIDLTMELNGVVTIFEGKNKFPENFAIYQLFNPFLYYQNLKSKKQLNISKITCCYLLRKKEKTGSIIRVYNYTFEDNTNIASIKLLKAKQYNLIQR